MQYLHDAKYSTKITSLLLATFQLYSIKLQIVIQTIEHIGQSNRGNTGIVSSHLLY